MNLLSTKEYFDRYREYLNASYTSRQAYEEVERELRTSTGFSRFASYHAFCRAKKKERELIKSGSIALKPVITE